MCQLRAPGPIMEACNRMCPASDALSRAVNQILHPLEDANLYNASEVEKIRALGADVPSDGSRLAVKPFYRNAKHEVLSAELAVQKIG